MPSEFSVYAAQPFSLVAPTGGLGRTVDGEQY